MAGVPQITSPVQSSGYSTATHSQSQNGEIFILGSTPKAQEIVPTHGSANQNAQFAFDRKDLLPLSIREVKDPALAVETLKSLVNGDLLQFAKTHGFTQLEGELEALSKTLYLSPSELVDEILNQENQNTMFSGHRFYDLLRGLARAGNEDMNQQIGILLKAINFSLNKQEILNALSANLKFLSEYLAANTSLSGSLSDLSSQFAARDAMQNFNQLKAQTLTLLNSATQSLLNDDKSQSVVLLAIHNLSRYNENPSLIRDSFSQLLSAISGNNLRSELVRSFEDLLVQLHSYTLNYTTKSDEKQVQSDSAHKGDNFLHFLSSLAESGFSGINQQASLVAEKQLRLYQASSDTGLASIRTILSSLTENPVARRMIHTDLAGLKTLDELVGYLNTVLRLLPDTPMRESVYESLVAIVNGMAQSGEMTPPTQNNSVMASLTGFIERNLGHSAMGSIDSFNASNLLQSIINAPGVFNPLAHYIIPLRIGDTQAFGELWVDNDAQENGKNSAETVRSYHLFLTFSIDMVGRFEIELYASGDSVKLTLLHPESYREKAPTLAQKASKIAAGLGYKADQVITAVLNKPRTLTQVFPKILERRNGIDVKA